MLARALKKANETGVKAPVTPTGPRCDFPSSEAVEKAKAKVHFNLGANLKVSLGLCQKCELLLYAWPGRS